MLTADIPSSRLSQGCTGQHALVEVELWTGGPPPEVTVRRPPAFADDPRAGRTAHATPSTADAGPATAVTYAPGPYGRLGPPEPGDPHIERPHHRKATP
ncbi:hypothetical protein [Streptomyces sp. NPDC008139]|uniref:hypothetical protein n=1 Tax=Streptomyces sp. NPDC008139 TaxID=3364814 RepID=UPI0036F0FDBA